MLCRRPPGRCYTTGSEVVIQRSTDRRIRRAARAATWVLVLSLVASAARADTVYLTNGNTFEDVVAEWVDGQARIQMPYGEIRLGKNKVSRIEKASSALGEFLERKRVIEYDRESTAADLLELALWARGEGLAHNFRETLLLTASLDPYLEGLTPLMHTIGYRFDPDLQRWITEAEAMRKKGFVLSNGHWITREEFAALEAARREREAARLAEERERRLSRVVELLALQQLEAARARQAEEGARARGAYGPYHGGIPIVYSVPGYFVPGVVVSQGFRGHGGGAMVRTTPALRNTPDRSGYQATTGDLIDRQPGSLLPAGKLVGGSMGSGGRN